LLQGYEGLRSDAGRNPQPFRQERLVEALQRLVQLNDALDSKAEASQAGQKLDEAKEAHS